MADKEAFKGLAKGIDRAKQCDAIRWELQIDLTQGGTTTYIAPRIDDVFFKRNHERHYSKFQNRPLSNSPLPKIDARTNQLRQEMHTGFSEPRKEMNT